MAESVFFLLYEHWLDIEDYFKWQSPIKGISLMCGFYALVNDRDCEPGKEGNKHVECSCLVYLSYDNF